MKRPRITCRALKVFEGKKPRSCLYTEQDTYIHAGNDTASSSLTRFFIYLNFFESVVFLLICSESCVVREWHKFEDDFQIFPSYISVHSFVSIRRLLLGTHPSDFVRNGSFLCAYIPENGFYLSGYFFFVPGISATLRISSLLSTGR